MDGWAIALGVMVMATGAAVQATVGFGASLLAVPILLLIDPRFVPGPATVGGMTLNLLMLVGHRAHADRRGVAWILVGLLPGTAIAALALRWLPGDDLAVLSGAAILGGVVLSAVGRSPGLTAPSLVGGGVLSGFMGTTAAVSGPPLALLYQRSDGATLRGTLPPTFLVGSILTLVALAASDRLPAGDWVIGAALAPGGLLGFLAARPLAGRIHGAHLRAAVLSISAASAVAAIVRALW